MVINLYGFLVQQMRMLKQIGEKQNANWDNTTPKAELSQIEKYSGFYVGRYEAGL